MHVACYCLGLKNIRDSTAVSNIYIQSANAQPYRRVNCKAHENALTQQWEVGYFPISRQCINHSKAKTRANAVYGRYSS